jgi:hypothetical protein
VIIGWLFWILWMGAVFGVPLIWLLFRGGGYKRRPLTAAPGPGWEATGERFLDPRSGELVAVYFCRRTGERAYVKA